MSTYSKLIRQHPIRFALLSVPLALAGAVLMGWTFPDHQVTTGLLVSGVAADQSAPTLLTPAQTAANDFNFAVSTLSFQNQVGSRLEHAIPDGGARSDALAQLVLAATPTGPYTVRVAGKCRDTATCGVVSAVVSQVFVATAAAGFTAGAPQPAAAAGVPSTAATAGPQTPAAGQATPTPAAPTPAAPTPTPSAAAAAAAPVRSGQNGYTVNIVSGPTIEPGAGVMGTRLSLKFMVAGAALGLVPAACYLLLAGGRDGRSAGPSSLERKLGVRVVATVPAELGGKRR